MPAVLTRTFPVQDYDLAATLASGQAFRWQQTPTGWLGVVANRWVRLQENGQAIIAETTGENGGWEWLEHYLQVHVILPEVLQSFPQDEPMRTAAQHCCGLRLLRQDPWECLASFILSSTKQIVQIQQIIGRLCQTYGKLLAVPPGYPAVWSFPTPARLAAAAEIDLRACKMGFRAPYLLEAARQVAAGELNLAQLGQEPLESARARLMELPGVGRKIADCVLLFAYGFHSAFPVDVWVLRGLRQLYFPRRRVAPKKIRQFADTYFGPSAGFAQQYLFHYMRITTKTGQQKI